MTVADKAFSSLQARAALKGITLHKLESDFGSSMYVATLDCWALTKQFDTLDQLSDWIAMVAPRPIIWEPHR